MIDVALLLSRLGISAKRSGSRLVARCPLPEHNDSTPSWAITCDGGQRHGVWYCFGCKRRGGPAALVQSVTGATFAEAKAFIEELVALGPNLPLDAEVVVRERVAWSGLCLPDGVVVAPLEEWPTPARRYLEGRRVSAATVARWGLGYAVGGDQAGRVVIPVRDVTGRLVGWQGRAFDDRSPKSKNAPSDLPGVDPGVLLGEEHWPEADMSALVVVEGPFDGFAVDVAGYAFACLRGSGDLHPEHARKLARGWDRLIIATDPDAAGEVAATLMRALGRWVPLVRLELVEDLAELHRRDPRDVAARLRSACES